MMVQRSSEQVYKCTSVQMYKCASVQLYKCTSAQVYTCSSVQVYKCTSVQVYKCASVQVYNCTSSTSDRGCLCELDDNRCWDKVFMLGIERIYASSRVIGVVSTVRC